MSGVHIEGSEPIVALIGLGLGIYFFFAGFRELKSKRIIQNIPTSKINTGAVGTNVEVTGRIVCEKDQIVHAPISGRPCAFYSIEIQRWERNRSYRGSSLGSHNSRNRNRFEKSHEVFFNLNFLSFFWLDSRAWRNPAGIWSKLLDCISKSRVPPFLLMIAPLTNTMALAPLRSSIKKPLPELKLSTVTQRPLLNPLRELWLPNELPR